MNSREASISLPSWDPNSSRCPKSHLLEALDETLVVHGARVVGLAGRGSLGLLGGGSLDLVARGASREHSDDSVSDSVTDSDTGSS